MKTLIQTIAATVAILTAFVFPFLVGAVAGPHGFVLAVAAWPFVVWGAFALPIGAADKVDV